MTTTTETAEARAIVSRLRDYLDDDVPADDAEAMCFIAQADLRFLLDALTPSAPDGGWRWVPVEPTEAMNRAARRASNGNWGDQAEEMRAVWSAMLSAIPDASPGSDEKVPLNPGGCLSEPGNWRGPSASIAPPAERLRSALEQARDQFRFYEREHLAKAEAAEKAAREVNPGWEVVSSHSSREKAETNRHFADMLDAALSDAGEGSGVADAAAVAGSGERWQGALTRLRDSQGLPTGDRIEVDFNALSDVLMFGPDHAPASDGLRAEIKRLREVLRRIGNGQEPSIGSPMAVTQIKEVRQFARVSLGQPQSGEGGE